MNSRFAIAVYILFLSAGVFPIVAPAQSLVWRNDWRVDAQPTLFGYYDDAVAQPRNRPVVFSPNGELLLRTPAALDDEFTRIGASGNVVWHANVGSFFLPSINDPDIAMIANGDGSAVVAAQGSTSLVKIDPLGHIAWSVGVPVAWLVRTGNGDYMTLRCNTLSLIDGNTGQMLWQHVHNSPYCDGTGLVSSAGGGSYVSFDTHQDGSNSLGFEVQRFDAGGQTWSVAQSMPINSIVAVAGATDGSVFVNMNLTTGGAQVVALHGADGSPAWVVPGAILAGVAGSTPGPVVVTANSTQRLAEADGTVLWAQPAVSGISSTLSPIGADRIMVNGTLLDADSGAVQWSTALSTSDDSGASANYFRFGRMSDGNVVGAAYYINSTAPVVLQRFAAANGAALDRIEPPATAQGVQILQTVADAQRIITLSSPSGATGLQLRVRAVARSDGSTLWENGDSSLDATGADLSAYVALAGDAVVVAAAAGNQVWVAAYDLNSGVKRWDQVFFADVAGTASTPDTVNVAQPVTDGAGNVFVSLVLTQLCYIPPTDSYACLQSRVLKLRVADGSILWRSDDTAGSVGFPKNLFALDTDVLVQSVFGPPSGSAYLQRLSGSDGTVLWSSQQNEYSGIYATYAAADGNLLIAYAGGWGKLDPASGALLWGNDAYGCSTNRVSLLPDNSMIAGAAAGPDLGPFRPCVIRYPPSAGAQPQVWILDPPDPALTSNVPDSFVDSAGQLWLRILRRMGPTRISSLAQFDPSSGSVVGEQAFYAGDTTDPLASVLSAQLFEAPANNRLFAATYTYTPPAPATDSTVLFDTSVLAHGDLLVQASTDSSFSTSQPLGFHVTVTYSGDVPISGVQVLIASPWQTHATALACSMSSAANCAFDDRGSVLRATVDMQPQGLVDISGKFPTVPNTKAPTLNALAAGPFSLREPVLTNNFAHVSIVPDGVFANGFE